jgi:hypothetical protein
MPDPMRRRTYSIPMQATDTQWLRKLLSHVVLAVVLVFAQQGAVLHWLSHSIEASQHKQTQITGLDEHCDECAGLAGLASGLSGPLFMLATSPARHALVGAPAWSSAEPMVVLAYLSRAPPAIH